MCLNRATGESLKKLKAWVSGSPSYRLAVVMHAALSHRDDWLEWSGRDLRMYEYPIRPRCAPGTCHMGHSTAGDTSSCCGICGNLRPDLIEWIIRQNDFHAAFSGLTKEGPNWGQNMPCYIVSNTVA